MNELIAGKKSVEIYRTKNWPEEMSKKPIATNEILIKNFYHISDDTAQTYNFLVIFSAPVILVL
jgi:hypothetical protein